MRLEDGDVALRPLVEADAPAIAAAVRDPLVPYYTSIPENYTEAHAREFIGRGGNNYAIVDAETDELLGVVGFLAQGPTRAPISATGRGSRRRRGAGPVSASTIA